MNWLKSWSRVFWEDFKAWRRNEKRIAPRPQMRGRIYESKDPAKPDISNIKKAKLQASLVTKARVIRADGTTEDLGQINEQSLTPDQVRKLQEQNENG